MNLAYPASVCAGGPGIAGWLRAAGAGPDALASAARLASGIAALSGPSFTPALPGVLSLSGQEFTADRLSRFFVAVTSALMTRMAPSTARATAAPSASPTASRDRLAARPLEPVTASVRNGTIVLGMTTRPGRMRYYPARRPSSSSACPDSTPVRILRATRSSSATSGLVSE